MAPIRAKTNDILVPLRFLTTVGHFMAAIMIFYTKDDNVIATLGSLDKNASISVVVCASFIIASLCIQFLGLFGGCSFFNQSAHVFYIISNGLGCITLGLYMGLLWPYSHIWPLWVFLSLLPSLVEVYIFYGIFIQKKEKYW